MMAFCQSLRQELKGKVYNSLRYGCEGFPRFGTNNTVGHQRVAQERLLLKSFHRRLGGRVELPVDGPEIKARHAKYFRGNRTLEIQQSLETTYVRTCTARFEDRFGYGRTNVKRGPGLRTHDAILSQKIDKLDGFDRTFSIIAKHAIEGYLEISGE